MSSIIYHTGDALAPEGDGVKVIVHVCNDICRWGSGFVVAVSRKWPEPEKQYRKHCPTGLRLGDVQFVKVSKDIVVANMIGQEGIGFDTLGNPPIRYEAVRACLQKVVEYAKKHNASIHGPLFGAGLAGGKWEAIEQIIMEEVCSNDVPITIYALTSGQHRDMCLGDHVEFITDAQTVHGPTAGTVSALTESDITVAFSDSLETFSKTNLIILGGCSIPDGETWWRLK